MKFSRYHQNLKCNLLHRAMMGFFQPELQLLVCLLHQVLYCSNPGPEVIKLFFMLDSAEHEILNDHKYKNIKKFGVFLGPDEPRMLFFPLINVKMPTIVGILTFMSRKNFVLC